MIQDGILTCASAVFIFALLPTVASEKKPPLITCVVNAAMLLIIAGTVLTLGLKFNAVSNVATALIWGVIGWQTSHREET